MHQCVTPCEGCHDLMNSNYEPFSADGLWFPAPSNIITTLDETFTLTAPRKAPSVV